MDVSVVVATFGDPSWAELAAERAIPSAEASAPAELVVVHGATLAEARNAGAARSISEWLCFLDADDEIEAGYLEAMAAASGDLRAPSVRYVTAGEIEPDPISLAGRNISTVNPCVIGTLLRRELFDAAGGFWTEPAWEDWSLFRRCWLLGAKLEHVTAAVYRVNVNPAGRNSSLPTQAERNRLHRKILLSHAEWKRKQRPHR